MITEKACKGSKRFNNGDCLVTLGMQPLEMFVKWKNAPDGTGYTNLCLVCKRKLSSFDNCGAYKKKYNDKSNPVHNKMNVESGYFNENHKKRMKKDDVYALDIQLSSLMTKDIVELDISKIDDLNGTCKTLLQEDRLQSSIYLANKKVKFGYDDNESKDLDHAVARSTVRNFVKGQPLAIRKRALTALHTAVNLQYIPSDLNKYKRDKLLDCYKDLFELIKEFTHSDMSIEEYKSKAIELETKHFDWYKQSLIKLEEERIKLWSK